MLRFYISQFNVNIFAIKITILQISAEGGTGKREEVDVGQSNHIVLIVIVCMSQELCSEI